MVKTREFKKPKKPFADEEETVRKSPRASARLSPVKKVDPALKGTSKKAIVKREKPITVLTGKAKKRSKSKSKSKRMKSKIFTSETKGKVKKEKNLKIVFETRGDSVRISRSKAKKEKEKEREKREPRIKGPKFKKERKHYSSTDAKRSGLNRESREDSPTRGMSEIDRIKAALDDIANGREKNAARAAYKWRVHSDKLYRRLKGEVKPDHRNGPPPVLSRAEEDKLATWMQTMSSRGFYVSSGSLRNTVQNFLKQDKRKNPFTDDKPSMSWHKAFMSRNPKVKEATNMMTLIRSGKSREVIDGWFDELESFLTALGLMDRPDRVYHFQEVDFNMTGSTTGPFADLSQDFKEGSISICGVSANAAGAVIPPYFLFKGHGIPSTWNPLSGAPEKSGMFFTPKGSMTKSAYSDWLENHFLIHIGDERPVALLLDCPDGHIDVDAFVTAQQNGIHFFRVLANVKHRVRPLNKRIFNVSWRQELTRWTRNHRFVPVTYKNVARLIGRLWPKVSDPEKVKESFRRSGVYPLDRDAIDEIDPEIENQQVASWTYVKPERDAASESDSDDDVDGQDQDGDENELAPLLLAKFEMSMDEETKDLYRKRLMENWDHPGARHYQTWKELYEDAYGKIVPLSDVPMAHEEVTVGYEEQVQVQVQDVIMDMVNGSQGDGKNNGGGDVVNVGPTPMNIEIIEVGPSGHGGIKKIIRIPASAQMPTGEYRREGFEENGLSLIAEGIEISQFKLLDQGNEGAGTSNIQQVSTGDITAVQEIQGQVIAVGAEQMVTQTTGAIGSVSDLDSQVVTVLQEDGSTLASGAVSEVVVQGDNQDMHQNVEAVVSSGEGCSTQIQVSDVISLGGGPPDQVLTIDGIQIPVVNPSEVQETVITQDGNIILEPTSIISDTADQTVLPNVTDAEESGEQSGSNPAASESISLNETKSIVVTQAASEPFPHVVSETEVVSQATSESIHSENVEQVVEEQCVEIENPLDSIIEVDMSCEEPSVEKVEKDSAMGQALSRLVSEGEVIIVPKDEVTTKDTVDESSDSIVLVGGKELPDVARAQAMDTTENVSEAFVVSADGQLVPAQKASSEEMTDGTEYVVHVMLENDQEEPSTE